IDRRLRSGDVTQDEYKRHMNKLKDLIAELDVCDAELLHISKKIPSKVMEEDTF
ncbi:MAG: hypothetical protein JRJ19_12430, partial [Deltaproteobacteria bacterium]|nr:hypothetical protein [Deltaproteobacteria bacterium]